MLYIDNLLEKVVLSTEPNYGKILPARDFSTLTSLLKACQSEIYITKRQANLILKIFNKHLEKLSNFQNEIQDFTTYPKYARTFRELEEVKKVYIDKDSNSDTQLIIECSYILENFKNFKKFYKSLDIGYMSASGKKLAVKFTEENIIKCYDFFFSFDFQFDETIVNYYKTIKSWNSVDFFEKFDLAGNNNQYYINHLENELGKISDIPPLLLQDRSLRYQYFYNLPQNYEKTLLNRIATRKTSKLYIDQKAFSLQEVIECLVKLERLPLMVVFGNDNETAILNDMENFVKIVKNYENFKDVGFYFRLENTEVGKKVNGLIKDNNFNTYLTSDTKIVGIQNNKIPKFFMKNTWQPKSVLALGVRMINGKILAYSNKCDLIISYTDSEPVTQTWISN
ncbi:MAG: hypothetical protein RLZZ196_495 [Bacteroidota bacterium]|jgi:hypothetical protein